MTLSYIVDESVTEIDGFEDKKKAKIESLNNNYPEGFRHQWAVFLHLELFKTILDKNGKCVDLVPCQWSETFIATGTLSEDKKRLTCNLTGRSYIVL